MILTDFYLCFYLLMCFSIDINTLDVGVTFLFTEVAYPRGFCCRCAHTAVLPLVMNPHLHFVIKER